MSVKGVTRNARNLMRTSGGSLPPGPEHDETGSLVGSHHNVVGRPGIGARPSPCFFVPVHHAHGGHPRSRAVGFQRSALTVDGGRHKDSGTPCLLTRGRGLSCAVLRAPSLTSSNSLGPCPSGSPGFW